jgi:hypothetical protein
MHVGTPAKVGVKGPSAFGPYGVTGTSVAMAHRKPANSRAMAPVTTWACVPLATSRRSRVHRRTGAFQLISWMTVGGFSQAQVQMSAALGGSASGPGALDPDAAGRGVASGGPRPLPARLTGGRCGGEAAPTRQQVAWARHMRPLPPCRHAGHSPRAWPPTPRVHGSWPSLGATREACGRLLHRAAGFVTHAGRRRGGPAHRRAPSAGRRHVAAWRARRAASRARVRAPSASSARVGTATAGRAPARARRARGTASRRAVCTRSPGCWGSRAGTTPQQSSPGGISARARQAPQGPASETTMRWVAVAGRVRRSGARSPGRGPRVPREVTSAPCAGATSATALAALWPSLPMHRGRDWDRVDLRGGRCGCTIRRRWRLVSAPASRRRSTDRQRKS